MKNFLLYSNEIEILLFIVFSIGFRDSDITIREGEVATLVIQQIGDEKLRWYKHWRFT